MYRKEMISAIISHKDNLREDELKHHGILGQKWGVRNYQNKDGSYTEAGRERYGIGQKKNTKEGGIFSKKVSPPGYKPNLDKEIKLDSEEGKEVIERAKQLKKKQEKLKKLYEKDEKEHPYSSHISYKDLDLGEKYESKVENIKKDASEIANKINDDWKDFIGEAQIYQAAVGLLNKPADADDAARSIWFTVCEDGDSGLSATIYAQEKGIFETTKKNLSDFQEKKELIDSLTTKTLIDDIGLKDDLASQLGYNVSRKFEADIDNEQQKKIKAKGDNVLARKSTIGSADMGIYGWESDSMDKETADHLLKVPRAIARGAGSKSTDNYWFWDKVLDAVTNLGYSGIPYDEMTEAQWEKVGKEMADLS